MLDPRLNGATATLPGRWPATPVLLRLAGLLPAVLAGCAALTNPLQDGIPASEVSEELLAKPKDVTQPLPVSLLGQDKAAVYRLAPGDTLGVWIDGVLSSPTQGPPVYNPPGRSK